MSMLFVVLPRWRSQGLSARVSSSQRFSKEKDWRDRLCLRVLLATLGLRIVSFQIFKTYLSIRNSLPASHWILFGWLCCARWNLKMTSWSYFVLVYNCSGEPFVHPDISGTFLIYMLESEFEVVAPTSEEVVRKGGSRKKSLTAALQS